MDTKYKEEIELLTQWRWKYLPRDLQICISFGYKELAITNGWRMGYCECLMIKDEDGKLKYIGCNIFLDDDHTKCPKFFRDSTLWHEFCHLWDCTEKAHVDHCTNFTKKKLKKPKYALGDVLLKLIGFIWFD